MPYEMGLDIGCMRFGNEQMSQKLCLIVEKEKNRYDQVISDISGQDIKAHGDIPEKIIAIILEWFDAILEYHLPSPHFVFEKYIESFSEIDADLKNTGRAIDLLSTPTYIKIIRQWIINNIK